MAYRHASRLAARASGLVSKVRPARVAAAAAASAAAAAAAAASTVLLEDASRFNVLKAEFQSQGFTPNVAYPGWDHNVCRNERTRLLSRSD